MYTREEAEGKRLRNPFDTITEGIGINRLTHNFAQASVDTAFRGALPDAQSLCQQAWQQDVRGRLLSYDEPQPCVQLHATSV